MKVVGISLSTPPKHQILSTRATSPARDGTFFYFLYQSGLMTLCVFLVSVHVLLHGLEWKTIFNFLLLNCISLYCTLQIVLKVNILYSIRILCTSIYWGWAQMMGMGLVWSCPLSAHVSSLDRMRYIIGLAIISAGQFVLVARKKRKRDGRITEFYDF